MDTIFLMELKLLFKCGRCNRKEEDLKTFLNKEYLSQKLKVSEVTKYIITKYWENAGAENT